MAAAAAIVVATTRSVATGRKSGSIRSATWGERGGNTEGAPKSRFSIESKKLFLEIAETRKLFL